MNSQQKDTLNQPSEETLRHQLDIQWQDHFQTRAQTWKTLEIVLMMLIAIIGIDIKIDLKLHSGLAIFIGITMIITTLLGIGITLHHRRIQFQKFKFIHMLESKLGLYNEGYMEGVSNPKHGSRVIDIFDLKKLATPNFILVMHFLILLFALSYLGTRFFNE